MQDIRAFRCPCCVLLHEQSAPGLCAVCRYHQSQEINQTVKRLEEHEAMLRAWLTRVEEKASNAYGERREFGEKMHYALRSRDRTIRVLRQINDLHELRSDGICKCRQAKCKIAALLDDRGIQALIRRVDEFEEKQRARDELIRQAEATGDPFMWDEILHGSGADGRRTQSGNEESA